MTYRAKPGPRARVRKSYGGNAKGCRFISQSFLIATANDEGHRLTIEFHDARGTNEILTIPVRVTDQDRAREPEFPIIVDFSRDRTGFFKDEDKRATVVQAARDWAYFFADMKLNSVAAGAEKTLIWGSNGFTTSTQVVNAREYQGFLLYAYGIRNERRPVCTRRSRQRGNCSKRDPAARLIRSGGEPSPYGGFQVSAGKEKPIRRSGGLEIEIQGNYNTRGWRVTLADQDWWQATNLGDESADLYSIAHHEIGHALIFNPNNPLIKRGEPIERRAGPRLSRHARRHSVSRTILKGSSTRRACTVRSATNTTAGCPEGAG